MLFRKRLLPAAAHCCCPRKARTEQRDRDGFGNVTAGGGTEEIESTQRLCSPAGTPRRAAVHRKENIACRDGRLVPSVPSVARTGNNDQEIRSASQQIDTRYATNGGERAVG